MCHILAPVVATGSIGKIALSGIINSTSFYLNGQNLEFHPQTQKLKSPCVR